MGVPEIPRILSGGASVFRGCEGEKYLPHPPYSLRGVPSMSKWFKLLVVLVSMYSGASVKDVVKKDGHHYSRITFSVLEKTDEGIDIRVLDLYIKN